MHSNFVIIALLQYEQHVLISLRSGSLVCHIRVSDWKRLCHCAYDVMARRAMLRETVYNSARTTIFVATPTRPNCRLALLENMNNIQTYTLFHGTRTSLAWRRPTMVELGVHSCTHGHNKQNKTGTKRRSCSTTAHLSKQPGCQLRDVANSLPLSLPLPLPAPVKRVCKAVMYTPRPPPPAPLNP